MTKHYTVVNPSIQIQSSISPPGSGETPQATWLQQLRNTLRYTGLPRPLHIKELSEDRQRELVGALTEINSFVDSYNPEQDPYADADYPGGSKALFDLVMSAATKLIEQYPNNASRISTAFRSLSRLADSSLFDPLGIDVQKLRHASMAEVRMNEAVRHLLGRVLDAELRAAPREAADLVEQVLNSRALAATADVRLDVPSELELIDALQLSRREREQFACLRHR